MQRRPVIACDILDMMRYVVTDWPFTFLYEMREYPRGARQQRYGFQGVQWKLQIKHHGGDRAGHIQRQMFACSPVSGTTDRLDEGDVCARNLAFLGELEQALSPWILRDQRLMSETRQPLLAFASVLHDALCDRISIAFTGANTPHSVCQHLAGKL